MNLNSSNLFEVRQNHIGAVLWPIAVPCGAQYLDAVQLTLEGIDKARRITASADSMHIVESADEMEQTHIRGEVAVLMGISGGHALGTSTAVLRSITNSNWAKWRLSSSTNSDALCSISA